MAKGARASTKKANHSKLKSRVFGPVESARTERLSAKLLELASQPKPKMAVEDIIMDEEAGPKEENIVVPTAQDGQTEDMEVDKEAGKTATSKPSKGRIEKKRSSSQKSSIVFPKYKNGRKGNKSKGRK